MRRVDAPPVVDEDVEDAERANQERSGPFRLEANCNHDARREPDHRDEKPCNAPLSPEDETDEEEDEQDTPREKEATNICEVTCLNLGQQFSRLTISCGHSQRGWEDQRRAFCVCTSSR